LRFYLASIAKGMLQNRSLAKSFQLRMRTLQNFELTWRNKLSTNDRTGIRAGSQIQAYNYHYVVWVWASSMAL